MEIDIENAFSCMQNNESCVTKHITIFCFEADTSCKNLISTWKGVHKINNHNVEPSPLQFILSTWTYIHTEIHT